MLKFYGFVFFDVFVFDILRCLLLTNFFRFFAIKVQSGKIAALLL